MARPTNKEYRAAILSAFDNYMHRTLKEVDEHLKEYQSGRFHVNYQSTRRMLIKMANEGLLITMGRGEKNAIIYTKALFNPTIRLKTMHGAIVTVDDFIRHVEELDSKTFDKKTLHKLKELMLNGLASSYEKPYLNRGTIPVAKDEVRRELNSFLNVLSVWHLFIKSFLDAPVWSDYNRENLGKEFQLKFPELHSAIVEQYGSRSKKAS